MNEPQLTRDRLASLLRDALEKSDPESYVEVRAESGYLCTVDGHFDLADVACRFLHAIETAK